MPTLETSHKIELQPIDYTTILAAIVNGIRAGVEFQTGRFASAQTLLQKSISDIQSHIHTQSPLLLPLLALQAEAKQLRKQSSVKVRRLLQNASDITAAIGASPNPIAAERNRMLANWRVQLSENDLAADLYRESLKHGRNYRKENHPSQIMVQIALAAAEGVSKLKGDNARTISGQVQASIGPLLDVLRQSLGCHDYRLGSAMTTAAWFCLLSGRVESAQRQFSRVNRYWTDQNVALGLEPTGYRQAGAVLGTIVASIQQGAHPVEVEPTFVEYQRLASLQLAPAMIAHELNRVGLVLKRAGLLISARYLFEQAAGIYDNLSIPQHSETVRQHIKSLDQMQRD